MIFTFLFFEFIRASIKSRQGPTTISINENMGAQAN